MVIPEGKLKLRLENFMHPTLILDLEKLDLIQQKTF